MSKPFKKKKLPKYGTAGLYTDPNVTGANAYGMKQDNPYLRSAGTSDEMSGKTNNMNYAALGQMGMQLGSQMSANQSLQGQEKERANEGAMSSAADKGIQMIPGFGQFYGLAKGGSDAGRTMIAKDENGHANSNMEQAADNFMNPTHQSITANASKGQHGEALMSAFINPAIGSIAGEIFRGTKFGDKATAYGQGEKVFPMGGNFQQGGNAQLEKQENTLNPDGSTTQFNLPSHEQQSAEEGTVLDPGTLIFSDRLKPKGNKKTFAILNKPNSTDKETKILEDTKSNTLSKKTAELMKNVKHKNSLQLFEEQEALKANKINNYIKRLGGKMQYPDGGRTGQDNTFVKSPMLINPNKNPGKMLSAAELEAIAHQYRGWGTAKQQGGAYVKKADGIMNDVGYLNPSQINQVQKYMDSNSDLEAFYQALPNAGRLLPGQNSAADLPRDSKLVKQYPYGGPVDGSGFPIDKTGRRLSAQEQQGFNRPATTYNSYSGNLVGTGLNMGAGTGINPNTGTAFMPLQNAGMGTGVKPLVPGGYQQQTSVVQNANESFEQAYQRTYGKPVYSKGGFVPKFGPGGYGPQTQQEANQYQMNNSSMPYIGNPAMRGMNFIGNPSYTPALYDQESDPNGGSANWDEKAAYEDQAYYDNKRKTQEQGGGSNWKNIAYQLGSTLANSTGALSYLGDKNNKTWDVEKERTYKPSLLDPTASLHDVDTQGRIARYDLADKSSGHSGNYLSNRSALGTSIGLAKSKVRSEFGNINSQISNRASEFNANSLLTTDDRTAANKGKFLSNKYAAIGDLGANTAQGMKDYKMNERDKELMEFMQFNDPAFQRKFDAYRKKKYGK